MLKISKYLILFVFVLTIGCSSKKNSDPGKPGTGNTVIHPVHFLSATQYDKLVVEIQYVAGNEPTASSINNLKAFLTQRLNKPAGITFLQNEITSPGKTTYSLSDIESVEAAHRTQSLSGKTLTAYFFFADGDYSANVGDSKVLGVAYGSTSMALFEKTILDYSGGIGQPTASTLETIVMEHEFGHILGLVNNGTAMAADHQDTAHGHHCTDTECLMYYSVETSDVIANIAGGSIPTLDPKCLADLTANGGK